MTQSHSANLDIQAIAAGASWYAVASAHEIIESGWIDWTDADIAQVDGNDSTEYQLCGLLAVVLPLALVFGVAHYYPTQWPRIAMAAGGAVTLALALLSRAGTARALYVATNTSWLSKRIAFMQQHQLHLPCLRDVTPELVRLLAARYAKEEYYHMSPEQKYALYAEWVRTHPEDRVRPDRARSSGRITAAGVALAAGGVALSAGVANADDTSPFSQTDSHHDFALSEPSYDSYDSQSVNTNGLPMLDGMGIDVCGNAFGSDDMCG